MKLFELFLLLELKGGRYETAEAGYINSTTGEVLEIRGFDLPHSSVIARDPHKFNIPPQMAHRLPDPNNEEEVEEWSHDNDGYAGPWQHVAYQSGWVRFYEHFSYHTFSGYPKDLIATLSLPGVIKAIVAQARTDPETSILIDIIADKPGGTAARGAITKEIHSAGDIVDVRKQIEKYV